MKKQPKRCWLTNPNGEKRPRKNTVDRELRDILGKHTRDAELDAPKLLRQVQLWVKRREKSLKIVSHSVEFHQEQLEDVVIVEVTRKRRNGRFPHLYDFHAAHLIRNNLLESQVHVTPDIKHRG